MFSGYAGNSVAQHGVLSREPQFLNDVAADLMNAVSYPRLFTVEGRLFENKLHGSRALVRKARQRVEMISRDGRLMGA